VRFEQSGFSYLIVADLSQADTERFEDQIRETDGVIGRYQTGR
jgi:hypothetical protein